MAHLNERGVTLIEMLVATMLLAVALAGLAASYPLAMQAVTGGGLQTTATLLAQQCIELGKSMPFDRVDVDLPQNCPTNPPEFPAFSRSVTVSPGPGGSATMKTITVTVNYHSSQGVVSTTVATIMTQ